MKVYRRDAENAEFFSILYLPVDSFMPIRLAQVIWISLDSDRPRAFVQVPIGRRLNRAAIFSTLSKVTIGQNRRLTWNMNLNLC